MLSIEIHNNPTTTVCNPIIFFRENWVKSRFKLHIKARNIPFKVFPDSQLTVLYLKDEGVEVARYEGLKSLALKDLEDLIISLPNE